MKYEENQSVWLPKGTRERLRKVAEQRETKVAQWLRETILLALRRAEGDQRGG